MLPYEPISHPPYRHDLIVQVAQFFAQTHNVAVNYAVEAIVLVASDVFQHEFAAEGATGMRGKENEPVKFFGREFNFLKLRGLFACEQSSLLL